MNFKKTLTLSLAALTVVAALAGCAPAAPKESETPAKTPAEMTTAFKAAIEGARDAEMNEAIPVITAADETFADMILPMLGITDENAAAYAVAVSPMNMQAYGIAVIFPAEGKTDAVKEGVDAFVKQQQDNFATYLPDQSEIAQAAKVETLEDGTVILVMSEGQDDILTAIKDALK